MRQHLRNYSPIKQNIQYSVCFVFDLITTLSQIKYLFLKDYFQTNMYSTKFFFLVLSQPIITLVSGSFQSWFSRFLSHFDVSIPMDQDVSLVVKCPCNCSKHSFLSLVCFLLYPSYIFSNISRWINLHFLKIYSCITLFAVTCSCSFAASSTFPFWITTPIATVFFLYLPQRYILYLLLFMYLPYMLHPVPRYL